MAWALLWAIFAQTHLVTLLLLPFFTVLMTKTIEQTIYFEIIVIVHSTLTMIHSKFKYIAERKI
jgi:hypothetical protein